MTTISTGNYTIGGGKLYFSTTIANASLETLASTATVTAFQSTARNLGNIVNIDINPDISYVDHFISVKGKRVKDKTIANTESVMINFTFDEMNMDNLNKFFLGSLTASVIKVFQNQLDEGSAHLVVDTDIGQDMIYIIPKCVLKPDGALNLTDEAWHEAPMILEVLEYRSADGTNATWLAAPFGRIDTSYI